MKDTISDFVTVIRNAYSASHAECQGTFSNVNEGIAKILKLEGYILDYKKIELRKGINALVLTLKYVDDKPALTGIDRISTPGAHAYCSYQAIPKVLNGLGITIMSTSKGVMNDRQARKSKLGGELICKVW